MNTYTIKGISDDQTECDCCGRKGLKRTVALEVFENGESTLEIIRVGVDCASVLMSRTNRPKSARAIKQEAEAIKLQEEQKLAHANKALEWKIQNRIGVNIETANKAYYAQFRSLDYRAQDHGQLLTNGENYVRIPSESVFKTFSQDSAEIRFIDHLTNAGYKQSYDSTF
jgi:hypothetical protein